ncbi:OmpA family protein [Synoicihabitans lomoniglobus]|uniref:OmpA family protein n=1 Tax=Synoicihabitans lomoniglobus TaxID=2909285 RepID=A0AAF0CRV9_9BACT|nr:OmpA family protein [Opitutaceae bacterium LMO-M01]WED66874.1 OmpA family protein [Opitutaceae bacterium LMO-M01]
MSVFAKKLVLVLTIATLGLTGCNKKPVRPDPGSTMIGPGGANGGAGFSDNLLNPGDVYTGDPLLGDYDSVLETRGGVIETDDMIRGLLEPVYFDFDQSGIKPSERIKLEAAIDYLNANPQYRLLLEGHCDWKGTAEYNLGLGDRRAGAARQFLETAGVGMSRLETASKGDLEAVENSDAAQASQDRRVDLVILKR